MTIFIWKQQPPATNNWNNHSVTMSHSNTNLHGYFSYLSNKSDKSIKPQLCGRQIENLYQNKVQKAKP